MKEQYNIIYTDNAKRKINEIYNYIKYDLLNPIAANNFYIKIKQKIQVLRYSPESFSIYYDTEFRYLIYKHWLIIYKIKYDDIVEIQTVISSKQNPNIRFFF